MKHVFIVVLALCQLSLLGCGGGAPGSLTQEDLKKRAIKRKKDDEDGKPNVAQNTATNTAQANAVPTAGTGSANTANQKDKILRGKTKSLRVESNNVGGSVSQATAVPTDAVTGADLPPAVQPPAEPLSPDERLQFAAENITQITEAIMAFVEQNGRYPPPAMMALGRPMLSWRVAILPQLGHQTLYDQFKHDEAWNSPHNRQLLERIPRPFQSPERFDSKTNYVLATGSSTAFPRPAKGFTPRQFEDGCSNTAILLEVDDDAAVPWTKPQDIVVNARAPGVHLGTLRGSFFLVGWADGVVSAVDSATPPNKLKAMFTVDAGEAFFASEVQQEIPSGVEAAVVADRSSSLQNTQVAAAATTSSVPRRDRLEGATSRERGPANVSERFSQSGPNTPSALRALQERLPVPDVGARKRSKQLVQSIFGDEYRAARTSEDKLDVAVAMLDEAKQVERGSADEYALLRSGWKIAIAAGDYETAEKFRVALVETFAVPDELKLQAEAVRRLSSCRLSAAEIDKLLTTAQHAITDAIHADDFDTAREMQQVAERLARRARDATTVRDLGRTGTTLKRLSREYRRVSAILDSVGGSNDPQASYQVGRYFCFFKGQWDLGLPLLAEGSDLQTRRLAAQELAASVNPQDQIAVADGWWEMSEDAPSLEKEHIQRHAAMIYQRALSGLRGLAKTKVTMRIDEFHREFGNGDSGRRLAIKQASRTRINQDDDD